MAASLALETWDRFEREEAEELATQTEYELRRFKEEREVVEVSHEYELMFADVRPEKPVDMRVVRRKRMRHLLEGHRPANGEAHVNTSWYKQPSKPRGKRYPVDERPRLLDRALDMVVEQTGWEELTQGAGIGEPEPEKPLRGYSQPAYQHIEQRLKEDLRDLGRVAARVHL